MVLFRWLVIGLVIILAAQVGYSIGERLALRNGVWFANDCVEKVYSHIRYNECNFVKLWDTRDDWILYGFAPYGKDRIYIQRGLNQSTFASTFWHEYAHAYLAVISEDEADYYADKLVRRYGM